MLEQYVQRSFSRIGLAEAGAQEDTVQEILAAIHTKRNTFDPNQFFLAWMYAIARYKTVDYLRKNGRHLRVTVPIEDELENLELLETHPIGSEIDVVALCETLPPKQREIIKLVKLQGLSVAEAASRTGFSPSDIKVNVHRALKALQKQIRDSGYEN